jgi:glutathione S-transferase
MPFEGILTIGTRRYSSWSLRGWLAVRLAGLNVEERVERLVGGGNTAAIKAVSPSGLVPLLEHRGILMWETIAICEYCAELSPAIWPADLAARTRARVISAEMHAGFRALRTAMPMNLGREKRLAVDAETMADIARVEAIWRETRALFGGGGAFLFGADFNGADAMFAPVVARFLGYLPELASDSRAYCRAVRQHPLVSEWYDAAAREPLEWRIAYYEDAA